MSDYARKLAQYDADQQRLARDMRNTTSQEREKYEGALAAGRNAANNK